jgi:Family of unknown function (DUF5856)
MSQFTDKQVLEFLLNACFKHQLLLKMFHFQTKKYGAHKTSDKYLKKFAKTFDQFLEVGQGLFGKFETSEIRINFNTCSDDNINACVDEFILAMRGLDQQYKKYPELLNIRDEIVGNAEQLKYLLTFN